MLLSVYAYGQPVLKKMGKPITAEYPKLETLIADMWETMYHANGVGLAAPQIGKAIRLFVVDTIQMMEEGREAEGLKKVFINAEKIEESGEEWAYEEGCLSIPDVRGDVERPANIRLRWVDENFVEQEATFTGLNARVIQHEYDHTDGKLFTEYLKPIKKRLIKRKLENIKKGNVSADYRMKFV